MLTTNSFQGLTIWKLPTADHSDFQAVLKVFTELGSNVHIES